MSEKTRPEVLDEVNAILESEGLPKWDSLKRIGRYRDGEFEITGVSHVVRDLKQYYVIIIFNVLRPDGSVGQYGVRATRRLPTCVVMIAGEEILFIQQHRPACGRWMNELPRGWIEPANAAAHAGGASHALLEREVGTQWVQSLDKTDPILLGSVWEDTGTRMDQVQIYLVETSRTPSDPPKHKGHVRPRLYSWQRVHELVDEGVINDQTTITALYKVERFLANRSAVGRDQG